MDQLRPMVPAPRLHPYQQACVGTNTDPVELYLWSGKVARAAFEDVSHVEVALRSAIAQRLSERYGIDWYRRRDILDYPTLKLIDQAMSSGRLRELNVTPEVKHGKLVATLMFGFWVKILGKGTNLDGARRIYDTVIWKEAVRHAFPNVGDLERLEVERAVRELKELRNRIAHHEHIIWGVPIPGQRVNGKPRRDSLAAAHGNLIRTASYLDRDFAEWIRASSEVPLRVSQCPISDTSRFLLK